MNRYLSSSDLKDKAKGLLIGKYGTTALTVFVLFLIVFLLAFIVELPVALFFTLLNGEETTLSYVVTDYVITGAFSILAGVLDAGLALFFLNIACGKPCGVSDLFYCFKGNFGKCLLISGAVNLPELVCMCPYEILSFLFDNTDNLAFGLAAILLGILGLVIYIPITLGLSMSYYLLLDFPGRSVKDILKMSLKLMKGHKGRLFYIECSFIPLAILLVLSLGVGFFWITPYMNMVYALFFLDLMENRQAHPF